MKTRRIIFILAMAGMLTLQTGCVYWRLYQFRNQLSSFPEHFRIEDRDQPALIALNPILMPDDPGWLMGLEPSRIDEHDAERLHVYHFIKMHAENFDEESDYDIVLATRFIDDRLTVVEIPRRFEEVLTEEIFVEVFGPMRDGTIERRQHGTGWTWEEHKVLIPDKNDMQRYLGQPFHVERGFDNVVMTYLYRLKHSEQEAGNPKKSDLWMRITFGGEEQRVVQFQSYLGRLSVFVDLSGDVNEVKIRRL